MFKFKLTEDREVLTESNTTLADYQRLTSVNEWAELFLAAQAFTGKRIVFINATPQGGGVALMRHTLMIILRLLGVDAHWHVMIPDSNVFKITKGKFHNVLQAVSPDEVRLTSEDKQLYLTWIEENAFVLRAPIKSADVIVIDDPQPAGLIPYIKRMNPQAKIIYRSHIQIVASLANTQGTSQYDTWSFLWQFIRLVDEFIAHPIDSFVPDDVWKNLPVSKMPATTDPLDGLNKPLTEAEMQENLQKFNDLLVQDGQTPLDPNRPFIIQVARFDPSKGIPDVLESYRKLRDALPPDSIIPQLVICGNGSIDDTDGVPLLELTLKTIAHFYPFLKNDIKVLRLDPDDVLLNTMLRKSMIALQLSHKEGFEVKVTEALMKGKPVIAYNAGGIPLQVSNPLNGFLVTIGDTDEVAARLLSLVTNPELYAQMSAYALAQPYWRYQTMENATQWLRHAYNLVSGESSPESALG